MSPLSWISIFVSLCLLAYGVFSYLRIQGLISKSRVLVENTPPYQYIAQPEAPKALFTGDSLSVGVGVVDPRDSLAGRFGVEHPLWTVENFSVSGRTTRDIIADLQALQNGSYQMVIIQVGGKNITHFSNEALLKKDIASVLREAKRVGKKVILLTCGNVADALLFPRPIAFLWEHKTLVVRRIFMQAAEESDVTYVDLFREKEDDPFFLEPYRYLAKDLFHPSSEGYGLWYEELRKAL